MSQLQESTGDLVRDTVDGRWVWPWRVHFWVTLSWVLVWGQRDNSPPLHSTNFALAPVLKFLFCPHLIIVPVSPYSGLQQWLSQVWFSFKDIMSNRKTFLSLSVWACRHINPHSAPFPGRHIPLHKSLIHKKSRAKTVTEKQNYCRVSVSCDLWWQAHNLSKKAALC